MHAIIRKRQGIPWEKEEPKGMKANLEQIVHFQVMPNVQAVPVDALELAYGTGMAPKLVAEVGSAGPLLLRQKALAQILKAMSAPSELAKLVAAGLVPALNAAASENDDIVRTSATLALAQAARQPSGQRAMLASGSVAVLVADRTGGPAVCDALEGVRAHGLRAVLELGKSPDGCRALIEASAVSLLIKRVTKELEVPLLQGLALMALQQLMTQVAGLTDAIRNGALAVVVGVLSSPELLAREKAALALASLTTNLQEKAAAGAAALPLLIAMLTEPALTARHAAASALMSITVHNDCKGAAAEAGAPKALAAALSECFENELRPEASRDMLVSALTVNIVQAIDQVADLPKVRRFFRSHALEMLQAIANSDNPHVKQHASKAVAQVLWMP